MDCALQARCDFRIDGEVVFVQLCEVVFVRWSMLGAIRPHKDYFRGTAVNEKAIVFDDWEAVLQAEIGPERR